MKKFKKVIAMCLTAAMALSMMSIGAFAEEASTKSYVTHYEMTNDLGEKYIVAEATIYPGEAISSEGFVTRDILLLDETLSNTTSYTKDIKCLSGGGNSLNVWVRNNGSRVIKARLTYPTGSKPDVSIGYGDGGYTFNDTQSSDLTGTYKLYVRDAENTGEKINITVRARQFYA